MLLAGYSPQGNKSGGKNAALEFEHQAEDDPAGCAGCHGQAAADERGADDLSYECTTS